MTIKIYGLQQGFLQEQEKNEGPLDGEPTWQEPQIKKKNKALLADQHVTNTLTSPELFIPLQNAHH